jgi:hypothetical protein
MSRRRGAVFLAVAIASWIGSTSMDHEAAQATPPPRVSSSAECASCHAEIVKDWSLSLHRASFTDVSFQHGYAVEKDAFCKNCHAPDATRVEDGVACKSCHGTAPHDDKGRKHAQASCASSGCHEFAFEGATLPARRSELMQLTVSEHRESGAGATSCVTCHMRNGSHRFDVSRNATLLRESLAMSVSVEKNVARVRVTLEARDVGHAFPTGDMFRRLLVRVESGSSKTTFERRLTRTFGPTPTSAKKQMTDDTRLFPHAPTTLKLPIPPGNRPVTVRVFYQRLTSVGVDLPTSANPPRERLEDEILIAESTLDRYD